MPKLKDLWFRRTNDETEEKAEFKTSASVDTGGVFSVMIPEEYAEIAWKLEHDRYATLTRQPFNDKYQRDAKWKGTKLSRAQKHLHVHAPELKQCMHFINDVLDEYLTCETEEKLVIVYRCTSDISYFRTDDGEVRANGQSDDFKQLDGNWRGPRDTWNAKCTHSLGVMARVMQKVSHKRSTGAIIRYKHPDLEDGTHAEKLNRFILKIDEDDMIHDINKYTPEKDSTCRVPERFNHWQEIPYTEEAAKFFNDMMLSLAKAADVLFDFLGDGERVKQAIADYALPHHGRGPELLLPPSVVPGYSDKTDRMPSKNAGETKMKLKLRKKK